LAVVWLIVRAVVWERGPVPSSTSKSSCQKTPRGRLISRVEPVQTSRLRLALGTGLA
jgi:hypothetical protein